MQRTGLLSYDLSTKRLGTWVQCQTRTSCQYVIEFALAVEWDQKNPGLPGFSVFSTAHVKASIHAALTSIFFAGFCASGFFGSFTVSTPFLKFASILSGSILSGSSKLRWNEPKLRSCR